MPKSLVYTHMGEGTQGGCGGGGHQSTEGAPGLISPEHRAEWPGRVCPGQEGWRRRSHRPPGSPPLTSLTKQIAPRFPTCDVVSQGSFKYPRSQRESLCHFPLQSYRNQRAGHAALSFTAASLSTDRSLFSGGHWLVSPGFRVPDWLGEVSGTGTATDPQPGGGGSRDLAGKCITDLEY